MVLDPVLAKRQGFAYNYERSIGTRSSSNYLLELDVALALHESRLPRHIGLMVRQLRIELAMRITINIHALILTICIALIGIKESSSTHQL